MVDFLASPRSLWLQIALVRPIKLASWPTVVVVVFSHLASPQERRRRRQPVSLAVNWTLHKTDVLIRPARTTTTTTTRRSSAASGRLVTWPDLFRCNQLGSPGPLGRLDVSTTSSDSRRRRRQLRRQTSIALFAFARLQLIKSGDLLKVCCLRRPTRRPIRRPVSLFVLLQPQAKVDQSRLLIVTSILCKL